MRRYLLDTSVPIGYLNGRPGAIELVAPGLRRREVGTSLLVHGEAVEYVRGRRNGPVLYARLRRLVRAPAAELPRSSR